MKAERKAAPKRKAILAAERQSETKASTARKLIRMRARLNELLDLRREGSQLSPAQSSEAIGLVRDIKLAKERLIKWGVPASVLINSALLKELLRTMNRKQPSANFRSGGVGAYEKGSSSKFWS